MKLEDLSNKLKNIITQYDTQWFLGNLTLMISQDNSEQGLSSPMRQLYYLGGLLITSKDNGKRKFQYPDEEWGEIVSLLNEIEIEYWRNFFPVNANEKSEDFDRYCTVAMPSFLSYFNQGPLNYEEQCINWITDLFLQFDDIIEKEIGLKTNDFIAFYDAIDTLCQQNIQAITKENVSYRNNWQSYSNLDISIKDNDNVPEIIKNLLDERRKYFLLNISDPGISYRFQIKELESDILPKEKIEKIINILSTQRSCSNFLYYTQANPLNQFPIVDIGNELYQVFEIKQILHSTQAYIENICKKQSLNKYVQKKAELLENNIVELFREYFGENLKIFQGYYVDGCEQDILLLWKNRAFIIEAKAYELREPFRDVKKAYPRIKDDFESCIGYAYKQTKRVEKYFIEGKQLNIKDGQGLIIDTIDTNKYEYDFSIIVTQKSFGVIQADLNIMLQKEHEDDVFPWAIRFDDLEVFIKTLIAKKKTPEYFVQFLLMRELLHGHLICADELEVCGAYLLNKLTYKKAKSSIDIYTMPDVANIFDAQYRKGLGIKNERHFELKKSGKVLFR